MKTTIMKATMVAMALTAIVSSNTAAQEKQKKAQFALEIDPATFAFNGYGLHLRIQPKECTHLLIGIGTYAMDLPDELVNMNKNNKDEGWKVRLNGGIGFFAEHHFSEVNRKWFLGSQVGIQQYKIENETVLTNKKYNNLLFMAYGGYTWQPFKNGLYIKPWAGIGHASQLSGNNNLEGMKYDNAAIAMFATFHLGYTF